MTSAPNPPPPKPHPPPPPAWEQRLRATLALAPHGTQTFSLHYDATHMPEAIPAAVLIAITQRAPPHEPGIIFIERPAHMKKHAGQVALPGGRMERGESAIEAALREAHEEVALPPACVEVLGTLDTFLLGSGYAVTPVVGLIPPNVALKANPEEADGYFEAPLSYVLSPYARVEKSMEWKGAMRHYTEIMWQDKRIWGATAAMLVNFAGRLGL